MAQTLTAKINNKDLLKLKNTLKHMSDASKQPKTIPKVLDVALKVARGNSPYWSGDTRHNIITALRTKKHGVLLSSVDDKRFPVKHLWINAVPGFEDAGYSFVKRGRVRYSEVARTGNPLGYWNVTYDFLSKEFEEQLGLEIKQSIEGG